MLPLFLQSFSNIGSFKCSMNFSLFEKSSFIFSLINCQFNIKVMHNKHFIRHHTSQDKVPIIPKISPILPRQTVSQAQRPPPNPLVWIDALTPDRLCPHLQIRFQFLAVAVRVDAAHNPLFHHQRACPRYKRRRIRCSRYRNPLVIRSHHQKIYAGRRQIRLDIAKIRQSR